MGIAAAHLRQSELGRQAGTKTDLYMRAVGMDKWPVLEEWVARLIASRSYEDWLLLVPLSSEELACLVELAIEAAASKRRRRRTR